MAEVPDFSSIADDDAVNVPDFQAIAEPGDFTQRTNPMEHPDTRDQDAVYAARALGQEGYKGKGLTSIGDRFSIGISENFEERKARFKKLYPKGDMVAVNVPQSGSTKVMIRRSPKESWDIYEPGPADRNGATFLENAKEAAIDVFGDTGVLPEMGGELAGGLVGSVFGPGGTILGAALGSGAGHLLEEGTEYVQGTQKQDVYEVAKDTAIESGAAALGGYGTKLVTGPVNLTRGAGVLTPHQKSMQIANRGKSEGLPDMLLDQVTDVPGVHRLMNQQRAVFPGLNRYQEKQFDEALKLAQKTVRGAQTGKAPSEFVDYLQTMDDTARSSAARGLRTGVDMTTAGQAGKAGALETSKATRSNVNNLYTKARNLHQPDFDIRGLQEIAAKYKAGTPTAGVDGEMAIPKGMDADTSGAIELILKMDPDVSEVGGVSATDQLLEVRKKLFNAKTPKVIGGKRETNTIAEDLYQGINAALDNPIGGDDGFRAAWKEAQTAAAKRFEMLESSAYKSAANNETPIELIKSLAKGDLGDDAIVFYKNKLPAEQWNTMKQGVKQYLSENINDLPKILGNMDSSTRNLLFNKGELPYIEDIAQKISRLDNLNVKGILDRQVQKGALIDELLQRKDTRGIADLFKEAGGRDTPLGRELRAGYMDHLYQKALGAPDNYGNRKINPDILDGLLRDGKKNGLLTILTAKDMKTFNTLVKYLANITTGSDVGASMSGASAVGEWKSLLHSGAWGSAAGSMLEYFSVGRLAQSPTWRKVIFGAGKEPWNPKSLRLTGSVLGTLLKEYEALEFDGLSTTP